MKTLLFIAKAFAVSQEHAELRFQHLLQALQVLDFVDPKKHQTIQRYKELNPVDAAVAPIVLTSEVLAQAAQSKLKLSAEVRALIFDLGGMAQTLTEFKPAYQAGLQLQVEQLLAELTIGKSSLRVDPLDKYTFQPTEFLSQPREENPSPVMPQQPTPDPYSPLLGFAQLQQLKQSLLQSVIGQPQAIEMICQSLLQRIFLPLPQRPLASFFFIGPAATGKSLCARTLATALGQDWQYFAVPMSTMVVHSQSAFLDGNEPSYQHARPGQLTDFVRQHPKTVVVFEDIDKAHPAVIARLNSILARGMLRDQFGFYPEHDPQKTPYAPADVDFSQTIVIFTSKALEDFYSSPVFARIEQQGRAKMQATLLDALEQSLSPLTQTKVFENGLLRLLSQESFVLFKQLSFQDLLALAEQSLQQTQQRLLSQFGCTLSFAAPEALLQLHLCSLAPHLDAARISQQLTELWLQPLYQSTEAKLPDLFEWQLSAAAAAQLEELKIAAGTEELAAWLRRKGVVVQCQTQVLRENAGLQARIEHLYVSRVVQKSDLQGLGSIQIEVPAVRFADIAGHLLVKNRLAEIVRLLKDPAQIRQHQIHLPKGLLLYGPPGTGKTMLAKALAHEADLPFIQVNGVELLQLDFLKALFARARKYAPAILFIDEIDVIGSREGKGFQVIINQLLTEIDGFAGDVAAPVFIVAATNRLHDLDPALLRAGRLDLKIQVPTLDREARRYFIQKYLALPQDGSLQEEALLNLTSGMTGAELEQIRREVVLDMIRQQKHQIQHSLLIEFINQRKYGQRATVQRTLADLTATAYHEAGHAVVSRVLNPEQIIEQISIVPRGQNAGFVAFDQDLQLNKRMTKLEIIEEIAVLLAGRCAEIIQYGVEASCAGASNDLKRASALAYFAVAQAGLDPEIGLISTQGLPLELSASFHSAILARVDIWLKDAEALALSTLKNAWPQVESLVQQLLQQDVLAGTVLDDLV